MLPIKSVPACFKSPALSTIQSLIACNPLARPSPIFVAMLATIPPTHSKNDAIAFAIFSGRLLNQSTTAKNAFLTALQTALAALTINFHISFKPFQRPNNINLPIWKNTFDGEFIPKAFFTCFTASITTSFIILPSFLRTSPMVANIATMSFVIASASISTLSAKASIIPDKNSIINPTRA